MTDYGRCDVMARWHAPLLFPFSHPIPQPFQALVSTYGSDAVRLYFMKEIIFG